MIPFWAALLIIAGLWAAPHLLKRLLDPVWHTPVEQGGPYDWAEDVGLLSQWAREAEGELLAVYPASWVDG